MKKSNGKISHSVTDVPDTSIKSISAPTSQGGGEAAKCIKLFPDLNLALLDSESLGKILVRYPQDLDIGAGSICGIDIHSGYPVITRDVKSPKNLEDCLILDLDEKDDPYSQPEMIKRTDLEDLKYKEESIGAYEYINIKKKPGEKVHSVELSGLKIGYAGTTLFYDFDSFIKVCPKKAEIVSKNLIIETGFSSLYSVAEKRSKNGGGFESIESALRSHGSEKISIEENDFPFTFLYEMKGKIDTVLAEAGIELSSIPGMKIEYSDLVQLKLVVRPMEEIDQIERKSSSFEYKKRILEVTNGGKNSLNEDLLTASSCKVDNMSSLGVTIAIDDTEVLLTYLEGLSIYGDTFIYRAGQVIESTMLNKTTITAGDRKDYIYGNKWLGFQQSITVSQFPVLEKSSIQEKYYGDYIEDMKGSVTSSYWKNSFEERRKTYKEYEFRDAKDIESYEREIGTKIYKEAIFEYSEFKENPLIDQTIGQITAFRRASGDTSLFFGKKGSIIEANLSDDGVTVGMGVNRNGVLLSAPKGNLRCDFKQSSLKTNTLLLSGDFQLDGKFTCLNDFYVAAKNITLKSENMLYLESYTSYSKTAVSVTEYDDTFYVFNNSKEDSGSSSDREAKQVVIMGDKTDIYIQGESSTMVAGNTLNLVSEEDVNISAQGKLSMSDSDGSKG